LFLRHIFTDLSAPRASPQSDFVLYHAAIMAKPADEPTRLATLYSEMSEGQLQQIAGDAASLTQTAQSVLAAELRRRAMDIPQSEKLPLELSLPFLRKSTIVRPCS
jgi:hypothetical protein